MPAFRDLSGKFSGFLFSVIALFSAVNLRALSAFAGGPELNHANNNATSSAPVNQPQTYSQKAAPPQRPPQSTALDPSTAMVFPWMDDKYRPCGQECSYQKANENISFQVLYEHNKVQLIEAKDGDERKTAIRSNLKHFCTSAEFDADDLEPCFTRYKGTVSYVLTKSRRAWLDNEKAAADLINQKDGTAKVMTDFQKRQAQIPYVPTLKDMQDYYRQMSNGARTLTSEQYADWAKEAVKEPAQSDYILWKKIPKDKTQPDKNYVTVPAQDCQGVQQSMGPGDMCMCTGNYCYNSSEFDRAKKKFQQWKAQVGDELKAIVGKQAGHKPLLGPVQELTPESTGQISIDAFNAARMEMVKTTNERIMGIKPQAGRGPGSLGSLGNSGAAQKIDPNAKVMEDRRQDPDRDDIFVTVSPEDTTKAIESIKFSSP